MKKLFLAGVAALSLLNAAAAHADQDRRSVWQSGNVRVSFSPKWLSPDDWAPSEYEYIVTGIEKSNNHFKWTENGLYLNGRLCWPVEPVTCLKVDGRTELPTGAPAVLHDARATTAVGAPYSGVNRSSTCKLHQTK